ncbi:MAG: T9SS type A sorting domain-containing protein [Lentimicrobiaceae bacterium]|jgi:photosystem II stability/assembly factor-like uncharacterized protein|nr:T9SS type A sorting domain-containing protein [Lentimicrobiaceae bacterium]
MKTFTKHIFFLLLLACTLGNANAQDFWQKLTPIPGSNTKVHCLATNSKGHIFAGVDSYPDDGVFRSIDGGQSWQKVLTTFYPLRIKIDANDVIYLGRDYPSVTVSKDDGKTWNEVEFPEVSSVTMIYTGGQDTIYVGGDSNNGALFLRSYDGATTWDTMVYVHPFPTPDEGANTTERVSSMVITSDGVFYIGVFGYIYPDYIGGLYRSYDQGNTWERVATEVDFIEQLAINSHDDIFIASYSHGFCVLRSGAVSVEILIAYETYDVIVDHSDIVYASCYSFQACSYDNGLIFGRIPYAYIKRFYISQDGFLYAYHTDFNDVYRSTQPILSDNEQIPITNNIKLYPNPATDYITIQLPDNESGILSIYDLLGKKSFETTIDAGSKVIDISKLKSNIYMLKIETSSEVFTSKFIKN